VSEQIWQHGGMLAWTETQCNVKASILRPGAATLPADLQGRPSFSVNDGRQIRSRDRSLFPSPSTSWHS